MGVKAYEEEVVVGVVGEHMIYSNWSKSYDICGLELEVLEVDKA